jgi:hypothetical protein
MAAIIAPLPVYSPSSRYHRASRPRSSSPSNFPSACDIFFPFSHWCGCRSGHAPSAPPSASPLVRLLRCLELYIQRASTAASIRIRTFSLAPTFKQATSSRPATLPERTPTPPGPAASLVDREPPLPRRELPARGTSRRPALTTTRSHQLELLA